MPQLDDPTFRQSLTYVIEHNEQEGALGFIINKTAGIDMGEVFEQLSIEPDGSVDTRQQVLNGGPVSLEHGMVLHTGDRRWQSSREFHHGVAISSSLDILEDLARGNGPEDHLFILGHSGWAPGQLEEEFAQNAWLHCEANHQILFDTPPEDRLPAAAALLGVNLNNLVADSGHA